MTAFVHAVREYETRYCSKARPVSIAVKEDERKQGISEKPQKLQKPSEPSLEDND